jgi:hypothetical protein
MGYNARNDEIRDNVTRMQREWAHNAANWRPSAASLQRFPPKAICVVLVQDCCGCYFKASLADYRL